MDSDDQLLATFIVGASLFIINHVIKRRRRPRRWWRTELYSQRAGAQLMAHMRLIGQFQNFTRMTPTTFEKLLRLVGPRIYRNHTYLRAPISIQDRLAITLRFLASNDSYTSLQYTFKVSKQAISDIIPEVCSAIIKELKEYIKIPTTEEAWLDISKQFEEKWNFPHCVGALDGKHVVLEAEEEGMNEESWRQNNEDMRSLLPLRNIPRRSPAHLNELRDELSDYFMKEGKIPWQDRYS